MQLVFFFKISFVDFRESEKKGGREREREREREKEGDHFVVPLITYAFIG